MSKRIQLEPTAQESNSQNKGDDIDEYSHFESVSEKEVEKTQLPTENESMSDGELPHLVKKKLGSGGKSAKVVAHNQQKTTYHINLSPKGLISVSTEWPNMEMEESTNNMNIGLTPIVSND